MRTPTDRKILYRFWAEQLEAMGDFTSVRAAKDAGRPILNTPDEPQCGFYKRRLIANGPWVPVRIFVEQIVDAGGELLAPERMRAQVGEHYFEPADVWPWVWNRPISQADFRLMVAETAWAKSQVVARADPDLHVDFLTAPPPMFKTSKRQNPNVGRQKRRGRRAAGRYRA